MAALGTDLLAIGAGLAGRAIRAPRLPAELAALTASLEHLPALSKKLAARLGSGRADLGLSLGSSAVGAMSQMTMTSVADAALRVVQLFETSGYRDALAGRARDLFGNVEASRADVPAPTTRPAELPDGPIERYAQRISTVTLFAAAMLLPLSGPRMAARALAIGSPRAARIGREAYAAQVGRVLARRGVVACDPSVLRRLDRIDTVIIDAPVLMTGRMVITKVVPVRDASAKVRDRAALLLSDVKSASGRLRLPVRRGDWALASPSGLDVAIGEDVGGDIGEDVAARANEGSRGRGEVVALTHRGSLVALLRVEAEIDPLCTALIAAARKVGRVLVAGATPQAIRRVGADGAVAGGSRLAASVEAWQRKGRGVALVATRNAPALAAADCGIGILASDERRPLWGAHLLCGPDRETAWLVLESMTMARRVSGRSARIALLGTVTAALIGLVDRRPPAGRRALTADGVAALTSLAGGLWSARDVRRLRLPVPEDLVPWHALDVDEVFRLLDASADGLSAEQVRQRRKPADHPADGERGLVAAALSELNTPLTAPLAAGAAVSATTGSTADAILVLSVILANALLSGAQEVTARRTLRRLLTASALRVRLRRADGAQLTSADELVLGDVLALEPGDAVPADCRLISAAGLEMDESNLTGESTPVVKSLAATAAVAVADRTSMVYAGTTVAAGTATAVVVATGASTEAGRGERVAVDSAADGRVHERLRKMAAGSIPAAAAGAAGLFASGLLRGRVAESVNSAVALAVSAIPEGLPFVATVAELSASKRLAKHNILVRNARAMEALGRVDVVCFDKTGTLTQGRIQLRAVSTGRRHEAVEALGHDGRLVAAAALRASPARNGAAPLPHPTDRAVVAGAERAGVGAAEGAAGWRMARELPFEPERGFHAVLGDSHSGQLISVKGAPETVLPRCDTWRPDGRTRALGSADRDEIDAEVDRLAQQGLRVLAVAERIASSRHLDDARVERLELLGLLGLADATRPTAEEAVKRLRRAGIKVVMLTGDHPSTAEAIGAELDLLDGGGVVTGVDFADVDEATVDALVSKAAVFARVTPADKVAVVRSLRRSGHVVAVTGDGANDAPAIRLADIGIAMGDQGTTAARQAADLIVVDDRIETIADGVIEGRAMWAAVRDAVALLLGGNLGEILFTVGSAAISARPPLNTRQILFVNLMTDLLPALAVASRSPRHLSPEALAREGPESSLGDALTVEVARRAAATAVATTGGWLAARATGTARRASSVAGASLVASQLAQTAVASRGDPAVLAAVGLSVAALVGTVQTPVVSQFFGSRPLGPLGWLIVAGSAAGAAAIGAAPVNRFAGLTGLIDRVTGVGRRLRGSEAKP